jgi:hypothetical protein
VISTGKNEKFGIKGETRLLHDTNLAFALKNGFIETRVEYVGDGRRADELKGTMKIVEKILKEKKQEEVVSQSNSVKSVE